MKKQTKTSKRRFRGEVISAKMAKTIVVEVETKKRHALYGKIVKSHKSYHAHVASGEYKVGDKVIIEECRPISKTKSWIVIKKEN
jgi:small subunit ribosomal protein S17